MTDRITHLETRLHQLGIQLTRQQLQILDLVLADMDHHLHHLEVRLHEGVIRETHLDPNRTPRPPWWKRWLVRRRLRHEHE